MIDPRIVSRLTHVDSFTHTYICIYTSTHTRRYDPRYSYLRFSFVFIPKEIVSNERIVAVLEIRRFMIRKIRAFCYYVPSRTLHCLVCTISQKSFHCTFNILSLSLVYNYSFFLLPFFFFFYSPRHAFIITRIYPKSSFPYIVLCFLEISRSIISYLPSLLIFN